MPDEMSKPIPQPDDVYSDKPHKSDYATVKTEVVRMREAGSASSIPVTSDVGGPRPPHPIKRYTCPECGRIHTYDSRLSRWRLCETCEQVFERYLR